MTPDLARTLLNDLLNMLNNSRAYTRKRTVLLLYKVFLKYPEALRIAFPRLKEKLEDPDQAVVSASVNVICELAFRNPKNYIVLAPQLYGLLTGSSNNWMLIKIVKLVSSRGHFSRLLIRSNKSTFCSSSACFARSNHD